MKHVEHVERIRRGLTLIEVLIVIAILLAIGGLVAVELLPRQARAKIDLQRVQFDQIHAAMKQFRLNMDRWPNQEEGLAALWSRETMSNTSDSTLWAGPYLESPVVHDQWGHPLVYQNPSEHRDGDYYDLVSVGPDGEQGTEDDITNHDRLRNAEGELTQIDDSFEPAGT